MNEKQLFVNTPPHQFRAVQSTRPNAPGQWNSLQITVINGDTEIGTYLRNYHGYGLSTFFPFSLDGKWYALVSKDYTTTEIIDLSDMSTAASMEPSSYGFCPVEFYVPHFAILESEEGNDGKKEIEEFTIHELAEIQVEEETGTCEPANRRVLEWKYYPYAFVAGCVWGDDSSWKIQVVDLVRSIQTGKLIQRETSLGYAELPSKMSLSDAIVVTSSDSNWVHVITENHILFKRDGSDLKDGYSPEDDDDQEFSLQVISTQDLIGELLNRAKNFIFGTGEDHD